MPGGRPRLYQSPEEMQRIIDLYFLACKVHQTENIELLSDCSEEDLLIINDIDDTVPTMSGLALALGMSRHSLVNYSERNEFLSTVKEARQKVEAFLEQRLQGSAAAGTIFNLKNNFGWKDKTEQELTGNVGFTDMTEEGLDAKIQALINAGRES